MNNDEIIKYIILKEKIDIDLFFPITEDGQNSDSEFDKRFLLDRTYQYEYLNFRKRIRMVIYPNDNNITIYKNVIKISNILTYKIHNEDKPTVYTNEKQLKIPIKEIERFHKLKKIQLKMGR